MNKILHILTSLLSILRDLFIAIVQLFTRLPKSRSIALAVAFFAFVIVFLLYSFMPVRIAENKNIAILPGMTLNDATEVLKDEGIIRSKTVFKTLVKIGRGEAGIQAGYYAFEHKVYVGDVARRLSTGDYGIESLKITLPEGITIAEMGTILERSLKQFSRELFLQMTQDKEGFLFPDTYIFLPHADTATVVNALTQNFEKRIQPLRSEIIRSGHTLDEIINMASIIEGEARQYETRRMVSGVLWNRIAINMPLQVDAAFVYSIGKGTAELYESDLKKDHPYNTYTRKGLPPTPIGNPGLSSIQAALRPIQSEYLYFLTGNDGVMYYAETHDEHVANKRTYMR